jgi:hypothetical protein
MIDRGWMATSPITTPDGGVRPADTPRRSGRILVAAAAAIALVAGLLGGVIAY